MQTNSKGIEKKRSYYPVEINGKIKYIRDRKKFRDAKEKKLNLELCSERR